MTTRIRVVSAADNPVVIRNVVVGSGATTLASLTDVNVANTANGNVLVYNNTNSTFVLGPLDGGTF